MKHRRMVIGGNWKMYKTPSEAVATAKVLKMKLINVRDVDVIVCPPFIDIVPVRDILKDSHIRVGGQNLHWEREGAFTGEISAQMLKDAGCEYVIVGHSERRHIFGESDQAINRKLRRALESGLRPIFCIGETLDERKAGQTEKVLARQVRNGLVEVNLSRADDLVVAYEPVWAIGTGENATPEQAQEAHRFVRQLLEELFGRETAATMRIQYGGSVKPANAAELMQQEDVDGALVGGASLDPESFAAIVKAAEAL